MKYIALLRGVNVGGNNKLSMPELKAAFEQYGFSDVVTYINSGNILFSSEIMNEEQLKTECEALIAGRFRMNIPVAILSADNLVSALKHAPPWWNMDKESKHNAIFVLFPASVEEVFAQIGDIKPDYEKVSYYGKVIFWSAPLITFSKTRWSKVIGASAYDSITIRNANTAYKLAALAQTDGFDFAAESVQVS